MASHFTPSPHFDLGGSSRCAPLPCSKAPCLLPPWASWCSSNSPQALASGHPTSFTMPFPQVQMAHTCTSFSLQSVSPSQEATLVTLSEMSASPAPCSLSCSPPSFFVLSVTVFQYTTWLFILFISYFPSWKVSSMRTGTSVCFVLGMLTNVCWMNEC